MCLCIILSHEGLRCDRSEYHVLRVTLSTRRAAAAGTVVIIVCLYCPEQSLIRRTFSYYGRNNIDKICRKCTVRCAVRKSAPETSTRTSYRLRMYIVYLRIPTSRATHIICGDTRAGGMKGSMGERWFCYRFSNGFSCDGWMGGRAGVKEGETNKHERDDSKVLLTVKFECAHNNILLPSDVVETWIIIPIRVRLYYVRLNWKYFRQTTHL